MIHVNVLDLINNAATQCGINKINPLPINAPNWYQSPSTYKFKWIDFAIQDRTRLSGIASNIDCYDPDSDFRRDKGTFLKPGKMLQCFFPDLPLDSINCIGQKLASSLRARSEFDFSQLQVSDKPSKIYGYHGPFTSCMHGHNLKRFELYDNLENCSILYLVEGGKCNGRALLWTDVYPDKIGKIMDRVYFANDDVLQLFIAYAKKNGYWYKKNQKLFEHNFLNSSGETFSENIWIETPNLIEMELEETPYVDTFHKYDANNFILSNQGREDTDLATTNGSDDNHIIVYEKQKCYSCGDILTDGDDIQYHDGNAYCQTCFDETFSYCEDCQDYCSADECTWVNDVCVCNYHLQRNYFECHECNEYFQNDESIRDIATDNCYCQECANDHLSYCDSCQEYTSNEVKECYDNSYYVCSECWYSCSNCDNVSDTAMLDGLCDECFELQEKERKQKILFREFDIAA